MPIRPENRDRYPADWPAISRRIRDKAGNKCHQCGATNGEMIQIGRTADGLPIWRPENYSAYMNGYNANTGDEVPDTSPDVVGYGSAVRVVLTVALLDHQPEICADENLRAWCQRCHNTYAAPELQIEQKPGGPWTICSAAIAETNKVGLWVGPGRLLRNDTLPFHSGTPE